MCSYFARRKSSGLGAVSHNSFPLSLVSSCAFVSSCFRWLIFRVCILLTNKKAIDKTTESIIIFHLLPHFAQTTRVNLNAILTRTAPMISPAGIGCAFVSLFQLWFIIYPYLIFDPPGRPISLGFQACRYSCCTPFTSGALLIITVSPSIILLIPHFDFFRPCACC